MFFFYFVVNIKLFFKKNSESHSCAPSDELVSMTEVSFLCLCLLCFWSVLFLGAAFVLGCHGVGVQTDLYDVKPWIHVCINSTFEC